MEPTADKSVNIITQVQLDKTMRFIGVTYRSRNESNSSYHQSPPLRWATARRTWKHRAHCTASRHSADWLWSFPGGWVGLTSLRQLHLSLPLLGGLSGLWYFSAAWLPLLLQGCLASLRGPLYSWGARGLLSLSVSGNPGSCWNCFELFTSYFNGASLQDGVFNLLQEHAVLSSKILLFLFSFDPYVLRCLL